MRINLFFTREDRGEINKTDQANIVSPAAGNGDDGTRNIRGRRRHQPQNGLSNFVFSTKTSKRDFERARRREFVAGERLRSQYHSWSHSVDADSPWPEFAREADGNGFNPGLGTNIWRQ